MADYILAEAITLKDSLLPCLTSLQTKDHWLVKKAEEWYPATFAFVEKQIVEIEGIPLMPLYNMERKHCLNMIKPATRWLTCLEKNLHHFTEGRDLKRLFGTAIRENNGDLLSILIKEDSVDNKENYVYYAVTRDADDALEVLLTSERFDPTLLDNLAIRSIRLGRDKAHKILNLFLQDGRADPFCRDNSLLARAISGAHVEIVRSLIITARNRGKIIPGEELTKFMSPLVKQALIELLSSSTDEEDCASIVEFMVSNNCDLSFDNSHCARLAIVQDNLATVDILFEYEMVKFSDIEDEYKEACADGREDLCEVIDSYRD